MMMVVYGVRGALVGVHGRSSWCPVGPLEGASWLFLTGHVGGQAGRRLGLMTSLPVPAVIVGFC